MNQAISKDLSVKIPTGKGESVTGKWSASPADARFNYVFAYAPGASSNINDPFGTFLANRLVEKGVATLRFQFPYMERGARAPDRPEKLETVWQEVIDSLLGYGKRILVGGRSMGGKFASKVVANGAQADALALFAYPLHSPGKADRITDSHFSSITVPTLVCSGDRDAFAKIETLRLSAAKVHRAQLQVLDGADHGYKLPKSSEITQEACWGRIASIATSWLEEVDVNIKG